ncbi:MAG: GAF domain-containing protein [Planctomycetota bacterium]
MTIDSLAPQVATFSVVDGALSPAGDTPHHKLASRSLATGYAELLPASKGEPAAVAIPVFKNNSPASVAVIALPAIEGVAGVIEIWEPVGPHNEVKLRCGEYGKLERFANVSSFVRFEKGMGLPGQSWARGRSVIHSDLPNHPGFLRAAGASAGQLMHAIAIPVVSDDLSSIAVLITSREQPLTRGVEVWKAQPDGFELLDSVYQELDIQDQLSSGASIAVDEGWLADVSNRGEAIIHEDKATFGVSRSGNGSSITRSLSIPGYHGNTLDHITTLLF